MYKDFKLNPFPLYYVYVSRIKLSRVKSSKVESKGSLCKRQQTERGRL